MPSSRAFFAVVSLLALGCAQPSGQTCELNSDCLQGTCVDGECVRECADSELDCPIGYVCTALGRCEYAGSPGSGGASSSSSGGAGGGPPASSSSSSSGSVSSSSSGMQTGLAELTLCPDDSACDSGMCREMTPGGEQRCTKPCSSHAQCPAGLRCEDVGGENYCARSDVGRACTAAQQCNFACLTPLDYCTSPCSTGADCPNGFGCMSVSNTKVCVKVAADCAVDASQCPAACDNSPNLVVSSCTMTCSSASDCPQRAAPLAAWTCDGYCRRPGDVYGPLPGGYAPAQWACNAQSQTVNVCGDGLHIDFGSFTQPSPPPVSCAAPTTTDGLPGDACLDSCRLQAGCPHGFACSGLAELGNQRIGLCMPSGGGEVGASCSANGQCAFGYCSETGVCTRDCSKDDVCPTGSQCMPGGGPDIEGSVFKTCQ